MGALPEEGDDFTVSPLVKTDLCSDQQIMSHLRKEQRATMKKLPADLRGEMYE